MTHPRMPQEIDAERAVLGACMVNPKAHQIAAEHITDEDFYLPHHAVLWNMIAECIARDGVADAPLVMAEERSYPPDRRSRLIDSAYLATLLGQAALWASVEPLAQLIAEAAVRRRLIAAHERGLQRAWSGESEVDTLIQDGVGDLHAARDNRAGVELWGIPFDEFIHSQPDEPEWLIPGLLAKGDRFILTGKEGLGKSTVLQQTALCAAAGVQPFDWHHPEERFTPIKVYMQDCENPDHDLKTRMWPWAKKLRDLGHPVEDRLIVAGHGNPIDLLDSTTAMSLMRSIEHHQPELVYVGPLYKLHMDDEDKALVVKKITGVLDRIRATGAALLCEAHATKEGKRTGDLAPSGSNIWTAWPEFGRGMLLDADSPDELRRCKLARWRIDRVERSWPNYIEAGGALPWARA